MDRLYYGGNIITMKGKQDTAEAVVVMDGKIAFCGTYDKALAFCEKKVQAKAGQTQDQVTDQTDQKNIGFEKIDLEGKTLMPSFIDPHGHISMMAQYAAFCDLSECSCFDEIIETLLAWKAEKHVEAGEVIIGYGYDHNFLKEQRHITREELDRVSKENPIFVLHTSGHMGVANSALIQASEIDDTTPDPEGGKFGRDEAGRLTGYVEETPALMIVMAKAYQGVKGDFAAQMAAAQQTYLRYGITTVQDGAAGYQTVQGMTALAKAGLYKLDIVSYVMTDDYEKVTKDYGEYCAASVKDTAYHNHFRVGGAKIVLDGSPQGKSAWLSRPYEGEKEYCGYPTHKTEEVEKAALDAVKGEYQLLAHCNGDAASEQFIDSYRKALETVRMDELKRLNKTDMNAEKDLRPVMIHCQTVRDDQLDEMAKLNMIPSIFVAHTYYWGDIHLKNLGIERGSRVSPVRSALERGLVYNFHQDPPVVKPDVMHTVWCAVNRITRNGQSIGPDQAVGVYDALKGVTINCAYEYHEEEKKGTIEAGKLADLVILDQNPLTIDPEMIKEIKVLETIKEGETVYQYE